jgi:hypothetical protein
MMLLYIQEISEENISEKKQEGAGVGWKDCHVTLTDVG